MVVKSLIEGEAPFEIRNYVEVSVLSLLDSTLESLGICSCQKCRADIMAMSLNALPPKYVVSERGAIFTKASALAHQNNTDIISAITRAASIVSKNPRH